MIMKGQSSDPGVDLAAEICFLIRVKKSEENLEKDSLHCYLCSPGMRVFILFTRRY